MWMPPIQSNERVPRAGAKTHLQESGTLGQILIVDDSREAGMMQAELLRMSGYGVELIADGRAALQAVELHQPDLIILDVQLPGIDGYTVCDALKRNPDTWRIPIIMVTVEGQLDARGAPGGLSVAMRRTRSRTRRGSVVRRRDVEIFRPRSAGGRSGSCGRRRVPWR